MNAETASFWMQCWGSPTRVLWANCLQSLAAPLDSGLQLETVLRGQLVVPVKRLTNVFVRRSWREAVRKADSLPLQYESESLMSCSMCYAATWNWQWNTVPAIDPSNLDEFTLSGRAIALFLHALMELSLPPVAFWTPAVWSPAISLRSPHWIPPFTCLVCPWWFLQILSS
jgi:hypothetical protein